MALSVIIPIYNEITSLKIILERVQSTKLAEEIILIDDGSTDGTRDVLTSLEGNPGIKVIFHSQNQGKGAAVRSGISIATGSIVIIQDADLEYDPRDYPALLKPYRGRQSRRGLRISFPWRPSPGNHVLAHDCQQNTYSYNKFTIRHHPE